MTESKVMGKSVREISSSSDDHKFSRESSFFSSSLHVLPNDKMYVNNHQNGNQSIEDESSATKETQPDVQESDLFDLVKDLLPDDEDELFAGIMDGFNVSRLTNHVDDLEDYDLFGSGGGIEIESDPKESLRYGISRLNLSESAPSNGMLYFPGQNSITGPPVTGEHPAGEHPSRTLFVRNINSNVEDSELMELFQAYGDIRNLYTACKHRGFVMISYYDIRAARMALRALQNKPLRRRKLDIHFSIPKDNPSDKDLNQGTLVVFNLDPFVSNEDLLKIFGVYGEVKEIRETPLKRNHKFIEFYDTRASEAALRALNGREIAGRSIKLEPSRPGGARRNLLHISQDQDQDESLLFRHQMSSSFGHSPPGNWSHIRGAMEQAQLSILGKSPDFRSLSPTMSNFSALASIMHPQSSNSSRLSPTCIDFTRNGALERMMNHGNSGYPNGFHQSLSFPDSKSAMFSGTGSSFVASSSNGSGMDNLSGPQSIWGSPKVYSEPTNSSSSLRGQHFHHHPILSSERHGFSFSGGHGPFLSPTQSHLSRHDHHVVGSAPSERHIGFRQNPQEAFMSRTTGGINMMIPGGAGNKVSSSGSIYDNTSSNFGMMHSPRVSPMFTGNNQYPGITNTSLEGFHDRSHNRRVENLENQLDNKQQFQLDLEKIKWGEDSRTTLMIKNIPNKYDSKMLLDAIDEKFQGTYDFLYLPIDFRNKCNVGYAFINMVSPSLIVPFYEAFNGKKWEKFNSEKVASIAYARIQGKAALVTHFQNSSVMNEDKRCRPIVTQPEGADFGDQGIPEQFQVHKPNGLEMKDLSGSPSDEIWYE